MPVQASAYASIRSKLTRMPHVSVMPANLDSRAAAPHTRDAQFTCVTGNLLALSFHSKQRMEPIHQSTELVHALYEAILQPLLGNLQQKYRQDLNIFPLARLSYFHWPGCHVINQKRRQLKLEFRTFLNVVSCAPPDTGR